jgi:hypothetical protein
MTDAGWLIIAGVALIMIGVLLWWVSTPDHPAADEAERR